MAASAAKVSGSVGLTSYSSEPRVRVTKRAPTIPIPIPEEVRKSPRPAIRRKTSERCGPSVRRMPISLRRSETS
jgi:hypothetical protein